MALSAANKSGFGTACAIVGLAGILAWQLDGISDAQAEDAIKTATFCLHYHTWAGSGTTGVDGYPCPTDDTSSFIDREDFCQHQHKFALNWTTGVVGGPSVSRWCDDPSASRDEPVPASVYQQHYHNNAGTGTTEPR